MYDILIELDKMLAKAIENTLHGSDFEYGRLSGIKDALSVVRNSPLCFEELKNKKDGQ